MISFHIWLFKKSIHTCKTMFMCWVSFFCNGFFTLESTAQATLVYNKTDLFYNFPQWWPIYHTISIVDIKLMAGPLSIMHLLSQGSWEWKLLWAQCQTFIAGYLIFYRIYFAWNPIQCVQGFSFLVRGIVKREWLWCPNFHLCTCFICITFVGPALQAVMLCWESL
jgi:hypothetical protein